jgi:hypothetical protein
MSQFPADVACQVMSEIFVSVTFSGELIRVIVMFSFHLKKKINQVPLRKFLL